MGNILFGIDIAKVLLDSIRSAGGLLPATLTVVTPGNRTPGQLSGGTNPTEVSHECEGFKDTTNSLRPVNTLVEDVGAVIGILGDSLPNGIVPKTGDSLTIESMSYCIVNIDRDPAAALYICQVR